MRYIYVERLMEIFFCSARSLEGLVNDRDGGTEKESREKLRELEESTRAR